tara:strand:- start:500 stop:931 length:432 start_codon:yes stop_codon:yes gene_type:complete
MFSFFKKNNKKHISKKATFEIELTGAVLAYEIARSDGNISQDELSLLMEEVNLIAKKVDKDKEEIFKIIEMYSKDSVSFHDFIQDINENYTKDEKLSLIEFLWKTAYADGKLDIDEEKLVRRVADLIQIKYIEVLRLKDIVKS